MVSNTKKTTPQKKKKKSAIVYFLSTTSSSASLAIVLLENGAELLPTTLDGLLTGLPEYLLSLGELDRLDGDPDMLVLLIEETKFCTLPPLPPLANLGPRIPDAPALCPDPAREMDVFPLPRTTSSADVELGIGLARPPEETVLIRF
jgi:hypothetical protein